MVRIKHRYILGNILFPSEILQDASLPDVVSFHKPSPSGFDSHNLRRVIISSILETFGEYGGGVTTPYIQVKYFSPATSTFIIRVHRDHYRLVWAALTMINRLPQPVRTDCVFQVVRVSGTIKKAEHEAIKRARETLRRAQNEGAQGLDFLMAAENSGSAAGKMVDGSDDDMEED